MKSPRPIYNKKNSKGHLVSSVNKREEKPSDLWGGGMAFGREVPKRGTTAKGRTGFFSKGGTARK